MHSPLQIFAAATFVMERRVLNTFNGFVFPALVREPRPFLHPPCPLVRSEQKHSQKQLLGSRIHYAGGGSCD